MYDGEGSQIQGGLSFCEVSSRLTHRLMRVRARVRRSEAFLSFRRF